MKTPICHLCRRPGYSGGVCHIEIDCTKNPKLNVGSGAYPKEYYINFDPVICSGILEEEKHLQTDVIGVLQDITKMFPDNYFAEIMSVHVIEHLLLDEALQYIQNQWFLLRPGGRIVIEGPDILGCFKWYNEGKLTLRELIDMFYPHQSRDWGSSLPFEFNSMCRHRSGWTGKVLAEEMFKIGFRIIHVGAGTFHKCDDRDFRVVGVKP
jgi:hypothetical protein